MRKFILFLIFSLAPLYFSTVAEARITHVRGYFKPSTHHHVAPHYKTTPNHTKFDNFSTKGNYNPFTGKKGTVNPFKSKFR